MTLDNDRLLQAPGVAALCVRVGGDGKGVGGAKRRGGGGGGGGGGEEEGEV